MSPGQSKVAEVNTINDMDDIRVITPTEDMGSVMCDFQEIRTVVRQQPIQGYS